MTGVFSKSVVLLVPANWRPELRPITQGCSSPVGKEGKPRVSSLSLWAQPEGRQSFSYMGAHKEFWKGLPSPDFCFSQCNIVTMTKIFYLCPTFQDWHPEIHSQGKVPWRVCHSSHPSFWNLTASPSVTLCKGEPYGELTFYLSGLTLALPNSHSLAENKFIFT